MRDDWAPACNKFDGVSSKNIKIVEACTALRNIERSRVSVPNVLFDLLAFEVFDLAIEEYDFVFEVWDMSF